MDPSNPNDLGKVVPSKLTIDEKGTITGTILVKDAPKPPLRAAVRAMFRDKTVLDSKGAEEKDEILPALHETTHLTLALSGFYESSTMPQYVGSGAQIVQGTHGFSGNEVAVLVGTAKAYGKTLPWATIEWKGTSFSLNLTTGQLERTQTDRNGTTLLRANQSLSLTGRYDPTTRSLVELLFKFDSDTLSDFTPDPNWKPRSQVEALLGGPKASKTRTVEKREFRIDRAPLLGLPGSKASFSVYVGFQREGKTPQPDVSWTFEQTVETTGSPTTHVRHKVVLGPPSKPSPFSSPILTVTFLKPN